MFNRYLSPALYRRLPAIYLVSATLLMLAPLSPLKWIPVTALGLAGLLTFLLRVSPSVESQRRRQTGSLPSAWNGGRS